MAVAKFTSLEEWLVDCSSPSEKSELEWFKSLDPYYRSRTNIRAREEARHSLIRWLRLVYEAFPDFITAESLMNIISEGDSIPREDVGYVIFFLRSRKRDDLVPSSDDYERWLLWELIY